MERLRPYPVFGFAALTLLIWGNRIWLAWTNDEDTVGEKLVWSTPITLFVLAAAAVLVLQARRVDPASTGFTRLVRVFAGGTVAYWAIRAPMILLADHELPFKVVHGVLAVVSIAAAIAAWRAVAGPQGRTQPPAVRQRDTVAS